MTISQNFILHGGDLTGVAARNDRLRSPSLTSLLAAWQARRRYRADLNRLLQVGPHMIADIGLTLQEAIDEAEKPFWKP